MPVSVTMILFIIGLFYFFRHSYGKAKIFLCSSLLVLFCISNSFIVNYFTMKLESAYPSLLTSNDKNIKYVLVLGSGHRSNDNLSAISQLSQTALMRLSEGIRLYKTLPNAKLIVSGYSGFEDKISHAKRLEQAAISLGIPSSDILLQKEPKDTIEEAKQIKKYVHNKSFIMVTSASHMKRAMKIFQKEGLSPIPAPTNYFAKTKGKFFSFPSGKNIFKSQTVAHEYLGLLWLDLKEIFH